MEYKKAKLIEIKSKTTVARDLGRARGLGKWEYAGQRAQAASQDMGQSWGSGARHGD